MCNSSRFSIRVTLFSRNMQLQPIFRYKLYFYQETCNSNRFRLQVALFSRNVKSVTDYRNELHFFSRNMQVAIRFQYGLQFSQEICNSKLFSIRVALSEGTSQPQPVFETSFTFLNKCATETSFLVGVAFFSRNVQLGTWFQYELHFSQETRK